MKRGHGVRAGPRGERRLDGFFDRIGTVLGSAQRRAAFAMYAIGLLSESERKSMEPIAARDTGGPEHADAGHQRGHPFISNAPWSDHRVRLEAARYVIRVLEEQEVADLRGDGARLLRRASRRSRRPRTRSPPPPRRARCRPPVPWTRHLAPLVPPPSRSTNRSAPRSTASPFTPPCTPGGLDTARREALLRYVRCPPIAQKRLEPRPDGLVRVCPQAGLCRWDGGMQLG
jgi:hypothetical protein